MLSLHSQSIKIEQILSGCSYKKPGIIGIAIVVKSWWENSISVATLLSSQYDKINRREELKRQYLHCFFMFLSHFIFIFSQTVFNIFHFFLLWSPGYRTGCCFYDWPVPYSQTITDKTERLWAVCSHGLREQARHQWWKNVNGQAPWLHSLTRWLMCIIHLSTNETTLMACDKNSYGRRIDVTTATLIQHNEITTAAEYLPLKGTIDHKLKLLLLRLHQWGISSSLWI